MNQPKIYFSHSRDPQFDYISMYDSLSKNFPNVNWIFPHQKTEEPYDVISEFQSGNINLILAEVSFPSTGQGIELGIAFENKILIHCIYLKGQKFTSALDIISKTINSYSTIQNITELTEKLDLS